MVRPTADVVVTSEEWLPLPVWGEAGRKIVAWAKVSPEDYARLKKHKYWLADGYAFRSIKIPTEDGGERKTSQSMHRDVMGLGLGDEREVDHRDGDRLHNTRDNLKVVSRYENEANKPLSPEYSSQRVGVCYDRQRRKWKAQASEDGAYVYLGSYETEEAAVLARERWERIHGMPNPDDIRER